MTASKSPYDVVVLGAGVLGLVTATALTDAGLRVAIVARDLPEDVDSAAFASPWAGANWSSFAANDAERRRDTVTFRHFDQLTKTHPDLVRLRPFVYVWDEDAGYSNPWYKDVVYNFRPLRKEEIPAGYNGGVTFDSWTLNPPKYIAHLASNLRARGVPIVRKRVSSLDEAFALFGPVDLVVNATGLGSAELLGVQDSKVHPDRGQTVLARAPGVNTVYGVRDRKNNPGEATYIIPRPGSDGSVILGGTNLKGDYSTLPRRETAEHILKKAFKLCPALAPGGTSWRDIDVISHNTGLRPGREGGLRLEIEERTAGAGDMVPELGKGRERNVAVLHCYGAGSAGYQMSHGVAEEAKEKVLAYLGKKGSAKL